MGMMISQHCQQWGVEVVKTLMREGDKDDDHPMTKWELVDDDDIIHKRKVLSDLLPPPRLINTNLYTMYNLVVEEEVCV